MRELPVVTACRCRHACGNNCTHDSSCDFCTCNNPQSD